MDWDSANAINGGFIAIFTIHSPRVVDKIKNAKEINKTYRNGNGFCLTGFTIRFGLKKPNLLRGYRRNFTKNIPPYKLYVCLTGGK